MYVEIDPSVNAAYVTVTENDVDRTEALDQRRRMDFDQHGELVGMEFLDVSNGVDLQGLPFRPQLERLFGEHHIPVYA